MIVSSFTDHIHDDMFRPVIAAVVGWCCNYVKGENLGRSFSFAIKIQVCKPSNGVIKYIYK